jgi:hypothetical protein
VEPLNQEAIDRMRNYFPPEEDKKQGNGGNGSRFNMEGYLNDYKIRYRIKEEDEKTKYILDQCPFYPEHKDSSIIQYPDGKLGFNCFHDHCQGKTWHDARQEISGGDSLKKYSPFEQPKETAYSEIKTPQDILSRLETWEEIRGMEIQVEWIVNKIIPKDAVTLLYGRGGIGKTWLVLGLARAIANGEDFQGYSTVKTPVVYIDFENPVSVLNSRTQKIGKTEGVVFWRGNNEKLKPPKLDSREWVIYKLLSPGSVLIFDSLRSSQNKDENSSQDMGLVMDRTKELRDLGFTIIILHHTPKNSDRVSKGSTAIVDLSDHIIGFHKVKKKQEGQTGPDVLVDDEDDIEEALYRFGTGEKTRFEPFRFYLTFNPDRGFELAPDPQEVHLKAMHGILDKLGPLNKTAFVEACRGLNLSKGKSNRMLHIGDGRYWTITDDKKANNRKIFTPKDLSGFPDPYIAEKPEKSPGTYPEEQKRDEKNKQETIDKTGLSGFPDGDWKTGKEGQGQEVPRYDVFEPLDI